MPALIGLKFATQTLSFPSTVALSTVAIGVIAVALPEARPILLLCS
jgi:hypothetical protein